MAFQDCTSVKSFRKIHKRYKMYTGENQTQPHMSAHITCWDFVPVPTETQLNTHTHTHTHTHTRTHTFIRTTLFDDSLICSSIHHCLSFFLFLSKRFLLSSLSVFHSYSCCHLSTKISVSLESQSEWSICLVDKTAFIDIMRWKVTHARTHTHARAHTHTLT